MLNKFKLLFMALPLLLAACASPQASDPGVQDIQPGEESIIQAPAPTSSGQSTLEERPL